MARVKYAVDIAPIARRDIQKIWAYIVAENPSAADRIVVAIDDAILRIGEFPEHAAHHDFYDARILPVLPYAYLIAYRVSGKTVEIMRVVDGRRHLPALLKDLL